MARRGYAIVILLSICGGRSVAADEPPASGDAILPNASNQEASGVDWGRLLTQSLEFLTVEQGFRYATQPGTRHPHQSFFAGYLNSLNNLHGWGDGDNFITNYVGHPMQGAVSGFLFVQNDRRYRTAQFGKNRAYWKSRLRAAAYSWAYSEQFEVGLVSEASIGNVAASYPQQGFVDQVVTPSIGLAWMVTEDWLDKDVIEKLERRIHNPYARLLIRGGLNPSRSLANALAGHVPWRRETREGVFRRAPKINRRPVEELPHPESGVAPFEFLVSSSAERFFGRKSGGECIGGGGTAGFRLSANWQFVGQVNGCKLLDIAENTTGDSLSYLIGPRWSFHPQRRWGGFAEVLAGGRTLTHEQIDPAKKAQVDAMLAQTGGIITPAQHAYYARQTESTGFAFSTNLGVDVKLTNALALRAADLGYVWSGNATLNNISYSHAVQFSAGLLLRMGTW